MIKHLSLFSGIESFKKAMDNLGLENELVGYSEIDKWASTALTAIHGVEENLNYGDITKIDETKLPDCDLITYGFPCSPKGQLVITEDGYKPIEDIQENDMVLTHNNKYEKVLKTMSRISKDMFKLKGLGFPELFLTSEHPLYIIRKGVNGDNPFWCDTKDVTVGDYLSINIDNKNINIYNLTKQECWLLGRYLADGYIKSTTGCEYIIFCIGKHKSKVFEANSTDFKMTNIRKESDSCYEYTCFDRRLLDIIKHIGTGSNSKTVPEFVIDLPNDLLDVFLRGYLSGDGSYQEKTKKETYCTSSKKVSLGIQRVYLKLYEKSPAIYKRVDNRKETFSDTYNGQIRHHVIPKDTFVKDGKFYSKVKQISYDESFNDYVYNFEVETDNSYTLENIIVHNCQDISVAGLGKGIIEGETRSGLLHDALRIIKYKKPKYAIAENVKNLVGKRFKEDFEGLLAELESYGYNNYWQVLNAKDYGIPQNRERVFVVSISKDIDDGTFAFPQGFDNGLRLKNLLLDEVEDKYYINNEKTDNLLAQLGEQNLLDGERFGADSSINEPKERKISNCITARYDNGIHNQKQRGLVIAEPKRLGGLYDKEGKTHQAGSVWDKKQVSPTITTCQGGHQEPLIVASRGRNPSNPSDRTVGSTTEQRLEPNSQGLCNTLTTVQKDNLVLEPNELKFVGGIGEKDWVGDGKEYSRNYPQGDRVYDVSGIACSQTAQGGGIGGVTGLYLEEKTPNEQEVKLKKIGNIYPSKGQNGNIYDSSGLSPTLSSGVTDTKGNGGIGSNNAPKIFNDYRIRKLTPQECWRLMGFDDEDYWTARKALEETYYSGGDRSNSQMYKMAGNSIVVDVLEAIFKELFKREMYGQRRK